MGVIISSKTKCGILFTKNIYHLFIDFIYLFFEQWIDSITLAAVRMKDRFWGHPEWNRWGWGRGGSPIAVSHVRADGAFNKVHSRRDAKSQQRFQWETQQITETLID